MANDSVVLKLTLDALGAREEASGLVRAITGFGNSIETLGAQMENTMRGRVIKGALGAFRDQFDNLMNDDLPAIVRESKLEEELATAMVRAIPEVGDIIAPHVATIAAAGRGPEFRAAAGSRELLNQLTLGGRVQFENNQDLQDLYSQIYQRELARERQAAQQRNAFDEAEQAVWSGLPSRDRPQTFKAENIAEQAREASGITTDTLLPDFLRDLFGGG